MFCLWLIYGPLGQHGSDWSRDLVILPFDLWGHGACGWCGSLSSVRISSLKIVGLVIRKIWRTMLVSINGPGDPGIWPFDPETGTPVASKVGNLPSNLGTLGVWVLELFAMYATDRQTDGRTDKSNAYFPLSYGWDIITYWLLTVTVWAVDNSHPVFLRIALYIKLSRR